MQLQIVLVAFLGSVWLEVIEGCSCGPAHPQEQFCRAEYVLRAKIISKEWLPQLGSTTMAPTTVSPSDVQVAPWLEEPLSAARRQNPYIYTSLVYTVYVDKVYKGEEFIEPKQVVKITTSPFDSMCGVVGLEEKKRYILSGQIADGELRVALCNYVKDYNTVTKRQKQGLKYSWKQDCGDCTPVTCYPHWQFCTQPITADTCRWEMSPTEYQCESDYASCSRDKSGNCSWYGKKDYKVCQRQRAREHAQDTLYLP